MKNNLTLTPGVPKRFSTNFADQVDANIGYGGSIGGSYQFGPEGSGIQTGLPGAGRAGVGVGAQVSVGITETTTYTTSNIFGRCQ